MKYLKKSVRCLLVQIQDLKLKQETPKPPEFYNLLCCFPRGEPGDMPTKWMNALINLQMHLLFSCCDAPSWEEVLHLTQQKRNRSILTDDAHRSLVQHRCMQYNQRETQKDTLESHMHTSCLKMHTHTTHASWGSRLDALDHSIIFLNSQKKSGEKGSQKIRRVAPVSYVLGQSESIYMITKFLDVYRMHRLCCLRKPSLK